MEQNTTLYKQNFFGSNLRHLRTARKMSQIDLGRLIGKKNSVVGSYEAGTSEPNIAVMQKIAAHFEVSFADLIERDLTQHRTSNDQAPAVSNGSLFSPTTSYNPQKANRAPLPERPVENKMIERPPEKPLVKPGIPTASALMQELEALPLQKYQTQAALGVFRKADDKAKEVLYLETLQQYIQQKGELEKAKAELLNLYRELHTTNKDTA